MEQRHKHADRPWLQRRGPTHHSYPTWPRGQVPGPRQGHRRDGTPVDVNAVIGEIKV